DQLLVLACGLGGFASGCGRAVCGRAVSGRHGSGGLDRPAGRVGRSGLRGIGSAATRRKEQRGKQHKHRDEAEPCTIYHYPEPPPKSCELLVVSCELRVMSCQLWVASCLVSQVGHRVEYFSTLESVGASMCEGC